MAWFVNPVSPWFVRGFEYDIGSGAGVFSFIYTYGHAICLGGFRVVVIL